MEMCVLKCEASGFNFGTNTRIKTGTLCLGSQHLTPLSPHAAFKYLGVRLSLTGNTKAEKDHVIAETQQISSRLNGHPFRTDQANAIVDMCVHPVLAYSCPLTQWTFRELQSLEHSWAVLQKKAWSLTDGHNTAPFLLPQEEGRVQAHTPARLLAKHTSKLMERLGNDLDGETLELVRAEWAELQATWGTSKAEEIQTMLLLEESGERPATLLAQTLYYTGLVGVTPVWTKIPCMAPPALNKGWGQVVGIESEGSEERDSGGEEDSQASGSVLGVLCGFMHASLAKYWAGDNRLHKFH
eukprot:3933186-Rhodomonas_salina.2